jgi:hypothetical protein
MCEDVCLLASSGCRHHATPTPRAAYEICHTRQPWCKPSARCVCPASPACPPPTPVALAASLRVHRARSATMPAQSLWRMTPIRSGPEGARTRRCCWPSRTTSGTCSSGHSTAMRLRPPSISRERATPSPSACTRAALVRSAAYLAGRAVAVTWPRPCPCRARLGGPVQERLPDGADGAVRVHGGSLPECSCISATRTPLSAMLRRPPRPTARVWSRASRSAHSATRGSRFLASVASPPPTGVASRRAALRGSRGDTRGA